jgi:hypothetical protein
MFSTHWTASNGFYTAWIMGGFKTFKSYSEKVLDFSGIKVSPDELDKLVTFDALINFLNKQDSPKTQILFWSDGLELQKPELKRSIVAGATDPFFATVYMEDYFKNAKSVLKSKSDGNPNDMGYLVRSLENDPISIQNYDQKTLDLILPQTSWTPKQKQAYLNVSKSQDFI